MTGQDTDPFATMFAVYASTVTKMHEPVFTTIDFEVDVDGRRGRLSVPGYVEMTGEPIRNRLAGRNRERRSYFQQVSSTRSLTSAVRQVEQRAGQCSWKSTASTASLLTFICLRMGSSAADLTSRVLRHERALIACTVALLTVLGWTFLLRDMPMGAMVPPLAVLVAMWWLMMLAMMLPSATPAILLYARVRQTRSGNAAIAQTWVFMAGYLAVWFVFSIVAALAQSLVANSSSMALQSNAAISAVLILAGVYQVSPFKSACLSQCHSPGQFISRNWRPGWHGAVRLG